MVKALTQEGYAVSVVARQYPPESDETIANANYWAVDLLDRQKFAMAWEEIILQADKLDTLIFCQRQRNKTNNWAGEIEIGLTVTREIIERLVEENAYSQEASIVVISSLAGQLVVDDEQPVEYHVAKAGLNQLVRYYAVGLGSKGIRVNSVSPGRVLKEESQDFYFNNPEIHGLYKSIVPLGRMVTSEEIANVVTFLSSPKASFVTGQNIAVDGGLSLQLQEKLARQLAKATKMVNA